MSRLDRRALLLSLAASPLLGACRPAAPPAPPPAPPPPAPPALPPAPLDEGLERLGHEEAAARGVDPVALRALVAHESSRSDQLVVLLDGKLVGRWVFAGDEVPIETMSTTKSIVSLGVGLLVDRKKLALDQPVSDFFPEYREGAKARVTVRHLMNHTSGIESGETTGPIYASHDFVQHALGSPLVSEPGAVFSYNNRAVNLLAGLVGRAGGVPVDALVRDAIFRPLGIDRFEWLHDRAGNPHGMSGLRLRAIDLSRIGHLVLDGTWRGQRLLGEAWIDASTRHASGPLNPRCGLLWWLEIDAPGGLPDGNLSEIKALSFAARGWLGQTLVVVPGSRLVAARLRASTPARRAASTLPQGEDPFEKRVLGLVKPA